MKIVDNISEMRLLRQQITVPVGFVPTMGYLHEGHISLVKHAKTENSLLVVSIFVNPTQFGPTEDFKQYPRDTQRDFSLLDRENVDIVFMPSDEEMYPGDFTTWVEVNQITDRLEGASRPTHFKGVTTVVAKLFNIIQPARAYFGQKDAQQLLVIKKMVADLNMNLEIITVPTMREPDGLAMSSRNIYLNPKEHQAALVLYQSLSLAHKLWRQGERNAEIIRQEMEYLIKKQPLAEINYISIADNNSLEELDTVIPQTLVSLAVKIGRTRLIDNILLK
ncbi:MAG: pantoate--beta-alanine ligase [Dehalococcoidales bacterium]|nr:pantoate--beta-alanine ligase [Dehalococcoidales bacterium]